jgi:hypothetical protein
VEVTAGNDRSIVAGPGERPGEPQGQEDHMGTKLSKGSRITGEGRADLAKALVERYQHGESIRSIADDIGRSYGFVHGVLVESDTEMRSRGGATRGKAAEERRAAIRKAS